ncbi:LysR family transcriptional regulator [Pseudidiomarina salinarum]|uniref:LysR family transcriptional regulator n=1 Tax=Pseudidiomarina salinarum TaxID=435908 RepID=A0A094IXC6_9GAMM|nr:LysR family transcriptional regulator [Pseudidiomarina salinarum]KFZ30494.1 LysR family transcriptional regulator [Pseudidiomarina salinarum]RUO68641.1 LysR family transcriptional regulator [Pseudidiomarina salinarum]
MQHLSLDALRAFISVYELQSYTAAGQQLGRSQPAISLQVQRLEEQLGRQLIHRTGGRIQLTQSGSELIDAARQLLNLNDQILVRFTESALSGRVRLGIPSEFASKLLPQVVGQFAQAYPNVTLAVTSALSKDLLRDDNSNFDLVVALTEPEQKNQHGNLVVLKQEPLVWVGPVGMQPGLSLVAAPEGCIYRRRAVAALRGIGQPLRISYTNADFSGLTAAIESGLGITVLAASTVPAHLTRLTSLPSLAELPELGEVSVVMQLANQDNLAAGQLARFISERL